ncbi:MAG: Coenzyme F420 hydrogenase/dehydrogenase, beta subunit C-terminal domain, partial [Solirubrobacteraceae bacterium]
RRVPAGAPADPVWGPAARMVIGHATDPELRHLAASGGVLTALADRLLRTGEVQFVVHVAPRADRAMRTERHISVDRAQLLRAAGSRYGPAAMLIDFCELLERGRSFALIGKPCDVSAVRRLSRRDPRVEAQMRYALTMVCGGASELVKSQDVLSSFGVAERDVSVFRYRGHGNPGLTHIETTTGAVHELTYGEMWSEDEATWRIQSRCKICPGPLGEGADIVAADCWDDGAPLGEDAGFNAILARTEQGVRLFDAAVADGTVTVTERIGFGDMDRFQPHQLAKKYAVWPRLIGMRVAGSPALRAPGLRLRSLALSRGRRRLVREAWGAYRRTQIGRLGERPPETERGTIERSLVG